MSNLEEEDPRDPRHWDDIRFSKALRIIAGQVEAQERCIGAFRREARKRSPLLDEIWKLKRSNAALRGVITKMKKGAVRGKTRKANKKKRNKRG